jgi:tetratricopeptide (TPR) repeat protein
MSDHGDVPQPGHEKPRAGKPRKPWYKHPSTLIALAAAILAGISAGISFNQANIAKDQNIVAEQQELVTLVGDIAQDPATITQESQMISNQSALSSAQSGITTTELVDSEEAATLIQLLHAEGVTATEYYQTAVGLQSGQSYAQALSLLKSGIALPSDPRTHASSLRLQAQIYYELGQVPEAERADALAEQAFNNVPDVTATSQLFNVVYTELFDAFYQASLSCVRGRAEMSEAQIMYLVHPNLLSATTVVYDNAQRQLRLYHC